MAGVFGCGYARVAVKAIFAPSKDHPQKIDQDLKSPVKYLQENLRQTWQLKEHNFCRNQRIQSAALTDGNPRQI